MALLGNIIWFILGGWLLGLLYFIGGLLLLPLLPFLLPFISYVFWPFGRTHVRRGDINLWKQANGHPVDSRSVDTASGFIRFLASVVWVVTFGWILALAHVLAGVTNLLSCLALITIPVCLPNALANFKLVPVAFVPFGVEIVPTTVADEIRRNAWVERL